MKFWSGTAFMNTAEAPLVAQLLEAPSPDLFKRAEGIGITAQGPQSRAPGYLANRQLPDRSPMLS